MFCEDQDIGTLVSNVKTENEDIRNSLHHLLVTIADGRGFSVQNMIADNQPRPPLHGSQHQEETQRLSEPLRGEDDDRDGDEDLEQGSEDDRASGQMESLNTGGAIENQKEDSRKGLISRQG